MSLNALQTYCPSTTYTTTNTRVFDVVQEDATSKDDSKDPFYRIAHDKPIESYNP